MPVAPFAGVKPVTVGGVVSTAATVVKVEVALAASALPARSFTPLVPPVTVTVYDGTVRQRGGRRQSDGVIGRIVGDRRSDGRIARVLQRDASWH